MPLEAIKCIVIERYSSTLVHIKHVLLRVQHNTHISNFSVLATCLTYKKRIDAHIYKLSYAIIGDKTWNIHSNVGLQVLYMEGWN